MMRAVAAATVLLAASASAAMAETPAPTPPPDCGVMHGRLAVIEYKPLTLYECFLSPDLATTIVVAGGEFVGSVAAADPDGLLVAKSTEGKGGNLVTLQPKKEEINHSPNLTFVTKTEDGTIRPYYFLFHVAGYGGVPAIQLTYPDETKAVQREAAMQMQVTRQQQLVAARLKTAPFYGGTNWRYDCMCDSGPDIKPDISDNGQNTILRYAGSTPSDIVVAKLDRDGTEKSLAETPHRETVVNFTPLSIGGPLVISDVAEYWRIRSGNQIIDIKNMRYHPERHDLRTGSQSPDVVRTIKPTLPPKPTLPLKPSGGPPPRVADRQ
jgi:hypothetical protein